MLHRRICNDYVRTTQRCNAVAILFRTVTTLVRHCCPKNRRCKSSRVPSPWHFWESYGEITCHSNFKICGRKPMVVPLNWNLFCRTFSWCHLISSDLRKREFEFRGWGGRGCLCSARDLHSGALLTSGVQRGIKTIRKLILPRHS